MGNLLNLMLVGCSWALRWPRKSSVLEKAFGLVTKTIYGGSVAI